MTEQFRSQHNAKFFSGKKAIALKEIKNKGGDIIPQGATVVICDKGGGGFHIQLENGGSYIRGVNAASIELIN